ncbi:uncharacterized protein VTP21DRAFT_10624 [Calcarisporiella thermophila]|uniref:uncharacterized protein n=1 Tax=Calcarisporiella thermophila TaxID=911321 RepID=UPI0037435D1B
MCGILLALHDAHSIPDWDTLKLANTKRGPDFQKSHEVQLIGTRQSCLSFFGCVLHLRGRDLKPQPIVGENGDVFCWNGEVFDGINVAQEENDTEVVYNLLQKNKGDNKEEGVLQTISKIEGPFSFVYWQNTEGKLWFSRDILGRRSMLWHRPVEDELFVLSSVGVSSSKLNFEEVPASGVYCLDIKTLMNSEKLLIAEFEHSLKHYSWKSSTVNGEINQLLTSSYCDMNRSIPAPEDLLPPASNEKDSNFPSLSHPMEMAIENFEEILGDSVCRRVTTVPNPGDPMSPRIAILFSGGLDCMCLAILAHRYLPPTEPIDLLNVAFENPRTMKNKKKIESDPYAVPDRKTARQGIEELKREAPREWRLVEINIPYEEAMEKRREIMSLMAPSSTVMDLSIAMAFWFAARGKGSVYCPSTNSMIGYQSNARVLLSGLGADEQLGGYSRHREAFRLGGWERLVNEIKLDYDRISERNLGRDDRIISDHGKEVRFPYLGARVTSFLCALPVNLKADPRYPRGVGEKLLLRLLAQKLGLELTSREWKRAVQFGARTARMTDSGERGTHTIEGE